jgi:hypothetical protein
MTAELLWYLAIAWCASSVLALALLAWAVGPWRWQAADRAGDSEVAAAQAVPFAPLSIIVCLHNEAAHLPGLLASLGAQDYPAAWEVVLVDDRSSDASPELLAQAAAAQPQRFRIVRIDTTPAGWTPKKWALTQGHLAARHPWRALTDADCRPGPSWARHLAVHLALGADAALGFSPLVPLADFDLPKPNRVLRAWVGYETLHTGALYIGRALAQQPYMAVGRNLAYTHALWQQTQGVAAHRHRLSGDDDLWIQAAGRLPGVRIVALWAPASQVPSQPPATWRGLLRQKTRHTSAASAYAFPDRLWLGALYGLKLLFWLLGLGLLALGLCTPPGWQACLAGLAWVAVYQAGVWGVLHASLGCRLAAQYRFAYAWWALADAAYAMGLGVIGIWSRMHKPGPWR